MSLSPRWGLCSEHEGKILGLDIGSPHAHRSYCGRKREEKAEGKASYVVDIDRSFRFFDRNAATRAARGEICADHECQREIRLDVQGPLQRSPGNTRRAAQTDAWLWMNLIVLPGLVPGSDPVEPGLAPGVCLVAAGTPGARWDEAARDES